MSNETLAVPTEPNLRWQQVDRDLPSIDIAARLETIGLLGSVGVSGMVEVQLNDIETPPDTTLYGSLKQLVLNPNDAYARASARLNVTTDLGERFFKAGHQSRIPLHIDPVSGEFVQYGKSLVGISLNTLNHSVLNETMRTMTETELKNAIITNMLLKTGSLEDHSLLFLSPTPQDETTKNEYGFFADTDTVSMQLIGKNDNEYFMEVALVAGKTAPDAERHDIQTIIRMLQGEGVAVDEISTSVKEILDTAILVPNIAIPAGIATIVSQFDDIAGGTFYGESRERQDYVTYAAKCYERSFDTLTDSILEQLIEESSLFETPIDAVNRLSELAGRMGVVEAVYDKSIDEAVFGVKAAEYIVQARNALHAGDLSHVQMFTLHAQKVETSSSCPLKNKQDGITDNQLNVFDIEGSNLDGKNDDVGGEREMTCPFCTEKTKGDPCASKIVCTKCNADSCLDEKTNQKRATQYHIEKQKKIKKKRESHSQQGLLSWFGVESKDELALAA